MHLDPMIGSGQGMEIKASIRDSGRQNPTFLFGKVCLGLRCLALKRLARIAREFSVSPYLLDGL